MKITELYSLKPFIFSIQLTQSISKNIDSLILLKHSVLYPSRIANLLLVHFYWSIGAVDCDV